MLDVVTNLEARVQLLEAQLHQTSRNSSKPPSSDPPSAPPPRPCVPRGRKRGAQVGHTDQQLAESVRAEGMLQLAHTLFAAWRWYRSGVFDQLALQQALIPVRLALHQRVEAGRQCEWDKLQGFCRDLLTHWEALWTFSRVEGMEPTNNRAERALRPAVVWRKSCLGTQSAVGSRFVERMLSVRATCAQQGRNLFAFLAELLRARFAGQPAPSEFLSP